METNCCGAPGRSAALLSTRTAPTKSPLVSKKHGIEQEKRIATTVSKLNCFLELNAGLKRVSSCRRHSRRYAEYFEYSGSNFSALPSSRLENSGLVSVPSMLL